MYKLKYYSLDKEAKNNLKKDFYASSFGSSLNNRLKRLMIIGIIGIMFSLYLFIFSKTKWDIVTGILLTLVSIFFIVMSIKIRINKLNDFLIKNTKKHKL